MKKEENLRIGIVGLGSVGTALKHTCDFYHQDVCGYDIKGNYDSTKILDCDVVFICVPTPENKDHRLDCSAVDNVLERLNSSRFRGIAAIRSTLRIGFMEHARLKYPGLRLVYCPEFLREKSRLQWTVDPDRIVLAGSRRDRDAVLDVFCWAENAEILIMDWRDAEVAKLAHNAYIATKVSFTNEIEQICREHGANPENVMDVITADRRVISKEHLRPHLGPYEGKCVPKDTRELIAASKSVVLLRAVENVNERTQKEKRSIRTSISSEPLKQEARLGSRNSHRK